MFGICYGMLLYEICSQVKNFLRNGYGRFLKVVNAVGNFEESIIVRDYVDVKRRHTTS